MISRISFSNPLAMQTAGKMNPTPISFSGGASPFNILQLLNQFFGGMYSSANQQPTNSPPAPQWLQGQFSGNAPATQQTQALYPSYTPDQVNLALSGQMYGALGDNNLPWTS